MPWMGAFDYGPLHFAALFNPASALGWYADDGRDYCMGTNMYAYWAAYGGSSSPSVPSSYSFPGNGTSTTPPKVLDVEFPTSPAALAGLSGVTGPNLVFYALDPADYSPTITAAQLTGPSGAVPVDIVNGNTPVGSGTLSGYDPGTSFVVPPKPLQRDTAYTATVNWTISGNAYTQIVSFKLTTHHSLPVTREVVRKFVEV